MCILLCHILIYSHPILPSSYLISSYPTIFLSEQFLILSYHILIYTYLILLYTILICIQPILLPISVCSSYPIIFLSILNTHPILQFSNLLNLSYHHFIYTTPILPSSYLYTSYPTILYELPSPTIFICQLVYTLSLK